jgi:hypothetical protein
MDAPLSLSATNCDDDHASVNPDDAVSDSLVERHLAESLHP